MEVRPKCALPSAYVWGLWGAAGKVSTGASTWIFHAPALCLATSSQGTQTVTPGNENRGLGQQARPVDGSESWISTHTLLRRLEPPGTLLPHPRPRCSALTVPGGKMGTPLYIEGLLCSGLLTPLLLLQAGLGLFFINVYLGAFVGFPERVWRCGEGLCPLVGTGGPEGWGKSGGDKRPRLHGLAQAVQRLKTSGGCSTVLGIRASACTQTSRVQSSDPIWSPKHSQE